VTSATKLPYHPATKLLWITRVLHGLFTRQEPSSATKLPWMRSAFFLAFFQFDRISQQDSPPLPDSTFRLLAVLLEVTATKLPRLLVGNSSA
jgi:hypothetical protein